MKRRFSWVLAFSVAVAHFIVSIATLFVVMIMAFARGLGTFVTAMSHRQPQPGQATTTAEILLRVLIYPADLLFRIIGRPEHSWQALAVLGINSLLWGIAIAGIIAYFRPRRRSRSQPVVYVADNLEDDYAPIRPQDR